MVVFINQLRMKIGVMFGSPEQLLEENFEILFICKIRY